MALTILDCTLRDGGYYNNWDFSVDVTNAYLDSMRAACVDVVELGLRSLINKGFKGANAFTTDMYLRELDIPDGLQVAVMINGIELLGDLPLEAVLDRLFPIPRNSSVVTVVRVACHVGEFVRCLPASRWLKDRGYTVGFNLMQIADRPEAEIEELGRAASGYPVDVLYFADSLGGMNPEQTIKIINWIRRGWSGALGVHTHDNMGFALQNSLTAIEHGVTWVDSTVTGMGRGPGNARTEELLIEVGEMRHQQVNIVPLMKLVRSYFQPLKKECGWGSNTYYYLSGKYGIHPTYIQEMLGDARYSEEDIFAAISHLKNEGGKKFSFDSLDATLHFYREASGGNWSPRNRIEGKCVLILGAGSSVIEHRRAIESYIEAKRPVVLALNAKSPVAQELIDLRVACHPVRLLADRETHNRLPQQLITPVSSLPDDLVVSLDKDKLLDFGIHVTANKFVFGQCDATIPNSLVISYALAIAASGGARRILLAGFDGFGSDDSRTKEVQSVLHLFRGVSNIELLSVTATQYDVPSISIYAMRED